MENGKKSTGGTGGDGSQMIMPFLSIAQANTEMENLIKSIGDSIRRKSFLEAMDSDSTDRIKMKIGETMRALRKLYDALSTMKE